MNSTPDFGEPWSADERPQHDAIFTKDSTPLCLMFRKGGFAQRASACVNACSKMADPEKEIFLLRAENEHLIDQLDRICKEGFDNQDTIGGEPADDYVLRQLAAMREAIREAHAALDGCLKYILKLPLSGSDSECETMDDAHHALAKLQPFLK